MKTSLYWVPLTAVFLLFGCGGGDNTGECSGSPEYCAEFAPNAGEATSVSTDSTDTPAVAWAGKSGTGDSVFEIPSSVTKIRILGTATGPDTGFIVHIGGVSKVNVFIGPTQVPPTYDGTLLLSGGRTVEITGSSGVSWRFSEVP